MANNQHLVEVLCAIKFDPSQNEWDSTFFGNFHELIKKRGYTEKKEQRHLQFQVEVKPTQDQPIIKEEQGELRMVFSNPLQKSAIILADNFVSFHKLAPYDTWDSFIKEVVNPGLEDYFQLGLGKGISEVQCLYLNKYKLEQGEGITKYFKFLPIIKGSKETQVVFQGKYDIGSDSFIQLKLNANENQETGRTVFFECSCFVSASSEQRDFVTLAQKAHDNANGAYRNVINDK